MASIEDLFNNAKSLEVIPKVNEQDWDSTFLWKGNLSHQALGGVTNGVWSYRSSEPLAEPCAGIRRNLGLILKPMHGGRAESKLSEQDLAIRRTLIGTNLIRPGEVALWVIAPSVFTRDEERVVRRLQVDELLDAYDTEVLTQRELGKIWGKSGEELGKSWRMGQC